MKCYKCGKNIKSNKYKEYKYNNKKYVFCSKKCMNLM